MMENKENPLLHEVKKQLYHVKENSIRTAEDKIGNLVETTLNGSEGGKDKPVTDVDAQSIAYAEEKAKNLAKKVRTYQRKKAARQQKEVQTEAKVTAEADIRQRNSMETLKSSEASQPTPKSTLRSSFSDEKKPLDMKLHIGETAPKLKTESIKLSCTSGEKMHRSMPVRKIKRVKGKQAKATMQKQMQKSYAAKTAAKAAAKKKTTQKVTQKVFEAVGKLINSKLMLIAGCVILFLLLVITVILLLVGGAETEKENQNRLNASAASAHNISENVLFYEEKITQYANENGIGQYVALIEAVMMQESGGNGVNVMQVDFGTVETVDDSIRMGIAYLRTCLEMARVTSPNDMEQIRLALQGYNYGTGYITWVWNNYDGVYSAENAQAFSDLQKEKLGWSTYGDPAYVSHVLRYYSTQNGEIQFLTEGAQFAWPVPGHTNITSGYGSRWGTTHKGIDISDGGIAGTPVVASRSGIVTRADNSCSHNYPKSSSCGCGGGYGNRVEISHGDGTSTLYGHMLTITVSVGETVQQGQIIGYVGCTGHSTGYHLHFEIKQNGTQIDPMPYL